LPLFEHDDFGAVTVDGALQGADRIVLEPQRLALGGNLLLQLLDAIVELPVFVYGLLLQVEILLLLVIQLALQQLNLVSQVMRVCGLIDNLRLQVLDQRLARDTGDGL